MVYDFVLSNQFIDLKKMPITLLNELKASRYCLFIKLKINFEITKSPFREIR